MNFFETFYNDVFTSFGMGKTDALSRMLFYRFSILLLCLLLMWLSFLFCKRIIKPIVSRIVLKTSVSWDDLLFNDKVLNTTCHLIPPVILYLLIPFIFYDLPDLDLPDYALGFERFFYMVSKIYIVSMCIRWCFVVLTSIKQITDRVMDHRNGYIPGVIQLFKILVGFVGFIVIISIIIGKSPVALFAGLGAAATILMLVFKDSILGLVAGVQLSANDMLRKGDWITMPQSGADGVVEEISLSTVKVRNFDNTITTIPPYTLISQSFQNWRGMQTSGGRRVRRSILIDMNSIRQCDEALCNQIQATGLIDVFNCPKEERINLILFSRAIEAFLERSKVVNPGMNLMVRQMPATAQGLPMELYFFLSNKEWVTYEHNMNAILAQVYAMMDQFGLKIFQAPSGSDWNALLGKSLNQDAL